MTTAARPTYEPAKGGSGMREKSVSKLSELVSSRDLKGHTTLKERRLGQGTAKELLNKDFRTALEEGERLGKLEDQAEASRKFVPSIEQATQIKLALKAEKLKERGQQKEASLLGSSVIDGQESDSEQIAGSSCKEQVDIRKLAQLDRDEDFGDLDGDSDDELASDFDIESDDMSEKKSHRGSDSDNDNDVDDDDDPALLMAELKRIKQERAAEEERLKRERTDSLAAPNFCADDTSECSFSMKRRWDDDVPFKNCAREDPNINKRRFLNDTVRRDFHKKFLNKYIR